MSGLELQTLFDKMSLISGESSEGGAVTLWIIWQVSDLMYYSKYHHGYSGVSHVDIKQMINCVDSVIKICYVLY